MFCCTRAGSTEPDFHEVVDHVAGGNVLFGCKLLHARALAGVKLTTGAFAELAAQPQIGRAEALRRSMARLIQAGGREAHPEYWAPFVLVGEGVGQEVR
jgi:CHAT domain